MAPTSEWSIMNGRYPEDVVEHATRLKAHFDLVCHVANANASKYAILPAELESGIRKGIAKGVAEACSSLYCPKWSDVDKSLFSKAVLNNIAREAAREAQDRIPLSTFYDLYRSYNVLYPKLPTQTPPSATTQQFGGAGTGAAMRAKSVVDLINDAKERKTEVDLAEAAIILGLGGQEEKVKDVNVERSGINTSEEEEYEMDVREDAGEGQEVGEIEDNESGDYSNEDGSGDNGLDHEKSEDAGEGQEVGEIEDGESGDDPNGNGSGDYDSDEESEDNEAQSDADGEEDEIQVGSPVPTYRLIVHGIKTNGMNLENQKEKSAIIKQLAIWAGNDVRAIIRDIWWAKECSQKAVASLIVEFLDYEEANRVHLGGLFWQGCLHVCERIESVNRLRRCSRCQSYDGHIDLRCSAPHRCGRCAGQHPTATCKSKVLKCASCGGGHRAGSSICPAKANEKKRLGFKYQSASQTTKSVAVTQATPSSAVQYSSSAARTQTETSMPSPVSLDADAEIIPKPNQSVPKADPGQDTYTDTASLMKRIEDQNKQIQDLREVVMNALQTQSSNQPKRRADEAFPGEVEAESSPVAVKRIKQEQPVREDSMGLYRQPSPYIVHRPE